MEASVCIMLLKLVSLWYIVSLDYIPGADTLQSNAYDVTLCSGNETKLTECLVDLPHPALFNCSEQATIQCCK